MKQNRSPKSKHSLGGLFKSGLTAKNAPQLTGTLKLQRHTFDAIAEEFKESNGHEVICSIAGWHNVHNGQDYLTVQLSAPYTRNRRAKNDVFDWIKEK